MIFCGFSLSSMKNTPIIHNTSDDIRKFMFNGFDSSDIARHIAAEKNDKIMSMARV